MLKLVAPMVGGVEASDGSCIEADEKIDGGPSVLFDAVALLPSADGAPMLAREPAPATSSPTRSRTEVHRLRRGRRAAARKAGISEADRTKAS